MEIIEIVIYILIIIGLTFNCLGSIGLIRFPDVYTRLHTATKATTFGSIFTTLAVVIYGFAWWWDGSSAKGMLSLHALAALAALLITNPTGAHAIARAAHRSGIKPYGAVVDQLEIAKSPTNAFDSGEGGEENA
ncbi:MAG TPA: cation:proton antiporter [Thermoplasmata archaeon]|nr:cation:proton antiporter [Thermoplasmata archaeon]